MKALIGTRRAARLIFSYFVCTNTRFIAARCGQAVTAFVHAFLFECFSWVVARSNESNHTLSAYRKNETIWRELNWKY